MFQCFCLSVGASALISPAVFPDSAKARASGGQVSLDSSPRRIKETIIVYPHIVYPHVPNAAICCLCWPSNSAARASDRRRSAASDVSRSRQLVSFRIMLGIHLLQSVCEKLPRICLGRARGFFQLLISLVAQGDKTGFTHLIRHGVDIGQVILGLGFLNPAFRLCFPLPPPTVLSMPFTCVVAAVLVFKDSAVPRHCAGVQDRTALVAGGRAAAGLGKRAGAFHDLSIFGLSTAFLLNFHWPSTDHQFI